MARPDILLGWTERQWAEAKAFYRERHGKLPEMSRDPHESMDHVWDVQMEWRIHRPFDPCESLIDLSVDVKQAKEARANG